MTTKAINETTQLNPYAKYLTAGTLVKNYRVFCRMFGEPIQSGSAKVCQLKNWARYFEFEKQNNSQAYLIKQVYDTPLQKIDERMYGNHSKYSHEIQTLIINYLAALPGGSCVMSKTDWFEMLGMCNPEFKRFKLNEKTDHIYRILYLKFFNTLDTTLNNLRERKIITYDMPVYVKGKVNESGDEEHIPIDPETSAQIQELENYILKNIFQCDTISEVYLKRKEKIFYSIMEKLVKIRYGYENGYMKKLWLLILSAPESADSQESIDVNKLRADVNAALLEYFRAHDVDEYVLNKYVAIEPKYF